MKVHKNQLWKVPVYCILAGIVSSWLTRHVGGRFCVVMLPDGSYAVDPGRSLIWYGVILLTVVGFGALKLFRHMERRDILASGLLWAAVLALLTTVQLIWGEHMIALSVKLSPMWDWSGFLSGVVMRFTGKVWLSAYADCLAPLVFAIFGQKD